MGNSFTLIACIGFGLLDFMENDLGFFILSLLLRGLQGFGDACASTTSMSIITIEFTEKKDQYFAYYQSAVGVGLMLGPVIGQLLYNAMGF